MNRFVLPLSAIDKSALMLAGGKGANLGELSHINGILVPKGFCITTEAYKQQTENNEAITKLLTEIAKLKAEEKAAIAAISAAIRNIIESIPIDVEIAGAVSQQLKNFNHSIAFAVRSSATAEDLPSASFAGQQDTYLNIIGTEGILKHITKCWASLFTERAVTYRIQNGFDHRNVYLAVIVQQMIFPEAAGILFTADPVSGNRKQSSVDASFGLGDALVAGLVNPDVYKINNGKIIDKRISKKQLAVYPLKEGGTKQQVVDAGHQEKQTLTDDNIIELERIGRQIEKHFGQPQDIEWCLLQNQIYVLQARPITTLYPIPQSNDEKKHVYISVGHNQMMTDAFKPLGLSFFLLTTSAPMRVAGARLFVDISVMLSTEIGRKRLMDTIGRSDPLIKDALTAVMQRDDLISIVPAEETDSAKSMSPPPATASTNVFDAAIVTELINESKTSIQALKESIESKSGTALLQFIHDHLQQLKKRLFNSRGLALIMAAMDASAWINEKMNEWLGEKNAADILSQSVPNNITSQMGLALLDVADIIRPYPQVIEYLEHGNDTNQLEELLSYAGGKESRDAISAFLEKYGMRCVGEIDVTRTRWSEKPGTLFPLLLSNIRNFEPGAGSRKFGQGLREALRKKEELMDRLKQLPNGEEKAKETEAKIDLVRNFIGYREYPKYDLINRYFLCKQAIMKEARRLVQSGVLHKVEDVYYLSVEELIEIVASNKVDNELIDARRAEYKSFQKLTPPRVMTSDGEIIRGEYKKENLPSGAIAGLAVSSGIIEGRARVILNMEDANIEDGDVLITTYTDPSWTPLFVSIKGLVTEVGGLMTHGAVIAREYGLPAVVGVENATTLIKDGEQIRVNGTEGYVEILR